MSITQTVLTAIVALAIFLGLDGFWLVVVAAKTYRRFIGHLMADKPNFGAAFTFYVLFVVGLLIFVLVPAINSHSLGHAAGYGAMFGFFTYATFDLTSQAVLKKWPLAITIIDMTWGVVLALAVSVATYAISTTFIK